MHRLTVRIPDDVYAKLISAAEQNRRSVNSELVVSLWHHYDINVTSLDGVTLTSKRHQSDVTLTSPKSEVGSAPASQQVLAADATEGSERQSAQLAALEASWQFFFPGKPSPKRYFGEWLELAGGSAEVVYAKMDETAEKGDGVRSPSAYVRQLLKAEQAKLHENDVWVGGQGWVTPEQMASPDNWPSHWRESA